MKFTLSLFITLAISSSAKEENNCARHCFDNSDDIVSINKCISRCSLPNRSINGAKGTPHKSVDKRTFGKQKVAPPKEKNHQSGSLRGLSSDSLTDIINEVMIRDADELNLIQDDDQCAGINNFCWDSDHCCGDLICHDFGYDGIYSDFLCTDEVPNLPSFDDDVMIPYQDDSQCGGIYSDCSGNIDCCGDLVCHDFGFAGVPTLLCTDEASDTFDNDIIPPQQDSQCVGIYGFCSSSANCCGAMTCHFFGNPGFGTFLCTDDAPSFSFDDDDHINDDHYAPEYDDVFLPKLDDDFPWNVKQFDDDRNLFD